MTNKELDQWIAENVMGLVVRVDVGWSGKADWEPTSRGAKHYTEDLSPAFEVVEKMRERGYSFDLLYEQRYKYWSAAFIMREEMKGFGCEWCEFGDADTPSMAICLAAKKAIENE